MLIYPLVNVYITHNYVKSQSLIGKRTISMPMFNSYVSFPKGSWLSWINLTIEDQVDFKVTGFNGGVFCGITLVKWMSKRRYKPAPAIIGAVMGLCGGIIWYSIGNVKKYQT